MRALCMLLVLGFVTPVFAQEESKPASVLEARIQELERELQKVKTEKTKPSPEEQEKQIVEALKQVKERGRKACKKAGLRLGEVGTSSYTCKA